MKQTSTKNNLATSIGTAFIVLATVLVLLGGCGQEIVNETSSVADDVLRSNMARAQTTAEAQADISSLVAGNTAFAFDLFNVARTDDENLDRNVVFAPYSLSLSLAMTYGGARGETESQMAEALNFTLPQTELHASFNALDTQVASADVEQLASVDSVWVFPAVAERVLPSYLDLLAENYGAEIHRAPADTEAARDAINRWTNDKTGGLIPDILPPGSLPQEYTALVLADALYLKAVWTYAFPPERTRQAPFYLDDGSIVQVPMMAHTMEYGYAEDAAWAALEVPFQGTDELKPGDVAMVFLLPKEGSLDQALVSSTGDQFETLVASMSRDLISIHVPRFTVETQMKLKDALVSLGMSDAFAAEKADLSGAYASMGDGDDGGPSGIWVDEIYHGGVLSVDESGVEAAAASTVVQVAGIGPGEITLDRPFLFLIRHVPTGAILFMGQVTNPVEASPGD